MAENSSEEQDMNPEYQQENVMVIKKEIYSTTSKERNVGHKLYLNTASSDTLRNWLW